MADMDNGLEVQWEDLVLPKTTVADAPPAPPVKTVPQQLPASYLTHELRAPVTAIRLGLEILQEQLQGRLRDDERQMLSVAVRNTGRLEGLVNDIMDYSKIMAGMFELDRVPCDPRALCDEAVDGMQAVALSQGVKLAKEPGEPLPRVNAEARRVVQVLVNLLSNAVKYSPSRGTVWIGASRGKYEHAGTIVFKVKDMGRGIPAEDIHKIFDMFIQAGNAKKGEGTGLGLTLSRLIVDRHGGRIWAESWKGAGSTFYFTIPICPDDLGKKVKVYPKPVEYSGLLVSIARRINAFLALFV